MELGLWLSLGKIMNIAFPLFEGKWAMYTLFSSFFPLTILEMDFTAPKPTENSRFTENRLYPPV